MDLVYGASESASPQGHAQMEFYMAEQGWIAMLVALLQRAPCVADAQQQLCGLTH